MTPISLYIDGDACPVRQEIYRVAERHAGKGVFLVTIGLDPPARAVALGVIQIEAMLRRAKARWSMLRGRMDCRIKSGNDEISKRRVG